MPGTLICFHAHPDDEAIATAGTIARAADAGHRVVLVFATRGELGDVPPGLLTPGESLAERRAREAESAAAILGAARVEFLGFRDSGMAGETANLDDDAFWRADVDEAAERLAVILDEERPEVLTIYDDHGGYHHPDHIQVHRVGLRAAALVPVPRVYEATADRDHFVEAIDAARRWLGTDLPDDLPTPDEIATTFSSGHAITTRVDVRPFLGLKRAALAAHASQIPETSFFLRLPHEAFVTMFGTEWFIRRDASRDLRETWLFPDRPGPTAGLLR